MARVYDAGPDTLTFKILGYATKGWGPAKRKTCIKTSEKNIHRTKIGEPGEEARIECLKDPYVGPRRMPSWR